MNHGAAEARRGREGQTFEGQSLLIRYVNFVKLPHTLFALPFALLGVLAASRVTPVGWRTILLVVLAFSAARWVAMGFNRIADRVYDARNPRTMSRELPRGALTVTQAWVSVALASALFLWSAWVLNPLWVRLDKVELEEFGIDRLFLVSRGKKLAIATFLGPDEKAGFAKELGNALIAARRGPTARPAWKCRGP